MSKAGAHLIPKFIVSDVPIIPMAKSMLLQILAACNRWRSVSIQQLQHVHHIWILLQILLQLIHTLINYIHN